MQIFSGLNFVSFYFVCTDLSENVQSYMYLGPICTMPFFTIIGSHQSRPIFLHISLVSQIFSSYSTFKFQRYYWHYEFDWNKTLKQFTSLFSLPTPAELYLNFEVKGHVSFLTCILNTSVNAIHLQWPSYHFFPPNLRCGKTCN